MQFSDDFKTIIETLKENEAEAFVKFLYTEVIRHTMDIDQAKRLIEIVKERFGLK